MQIWNMCKIAHDSYFVHFSHIYSKIYVKRSFKKKTKNRFSKLIIHNASRKFCRMLNSAILSTLIKLPFIINIFVLSIFGRPFYAGFTVHLFYVHLLVYL